MRIPGLEAINAQLYYHDRMTIYRGRPLQPAEGLAAIPCRLSMDSKDNNLDQQDDVNPMTEVGTVFCGPDWAIEVGDVLEIAHQGKTKKWIAGEPARYPNGQQIAVVGRGRG